MSESFYFYIQYMDTWILAPFHHSDPGEEQLLVGILLCLLCIQADSFTSILLKKSHLKPAVWICLLTDSAYYLVTILDVHWNVIISLICRMMWARGSVSEPSHLPSVWFTSAPVFQAFWNHPAVAPAFNGDRQIIKIGRAVRTNSILNT